jgi:hypothetical protein
VWIFKGEILGKPTFGLNESSDKSTDNTAALADKDSPKRDNKPRSDKPRSDKPRNSRPKKANPPKEG